ncbi:MAG: IS110 family transposase [Planctomycetes bacterium]|nr:IS110 family transposase [Planctomycetota bacterium]
MTPTIGIDWAKDEHAVCVLDPHGAVKAHLTVPHTREGLAALCRRLAKLVEDPAELRIALERPNGLLADTVVAAGFTLVPIHPNVVKASRPRYSAACAKDDRGDAYLLADLLRTDGHRFRALQPLSDEVRALRTLVRTRDALVAERVALANQLRSTLESFWAGAADIFADVDSQIGLAFLKRYPNPRSARRLGEKRLASFLTKHSYSGRRTPKVLLERLRKAPLGLAGKLEEQAQGQAVLAYVSALRPIVARVRELTSLIEEQILQLPAGRVVASFPRAGKVNAAQIVAELGDDPARFQSDAQLAAEAGVAPVTYASGKSRGVCFRWACNKRLRRAITCWADNSRHASPWARDVYQRARARGCDHPHAVRVLARAWVRVLWRCWRDGVSYEPALHGGALAFAAA